MHENAGITWKLLPYERSQLLATLNSGNKMISMGNSLMKNKKLRTTIIPKALRAHIDDADFGLFVAAG